jgi:uncharacterized protein DUF4350
MKHLSWDARLGIAVVLLLVVVSVWVAVQKGTEQTFPKLSSLSAAPDGARALKLWMEELQYQVDEQVLADFAPPETASIILMLEPSFLTDNAMKSVDKWVKGGGTLIANGEQYGMYSLTAYYEFNFNYLSDTSAQTAAETPLLNSPSAINLTNAPARVALGSDRADYVVLAAYQGKPVLVSFELGEGRVILGTTPDVFTNAGLKRPGNPELVLNILALAPEKGAVWFDEWHHGLQSGEQILGPDQFLRRTPLGRALLFVLFAVFITLFMQGRGFGRPVPLPQEIRRRGALEHVTGIANLNRRAAHRPAVMLHYHDQIKRKLGQRYRLDPAMDDEQYVSTLAGYNPALDKNELLDLLKRLKHRNVNETEMVHLAIEAAKWIDA